MKKTSRTLFMSAIFLTLLGTSVFADHSRGQCPMGKCPYSGKFSKGEGKSMCPITDKLMSKAEFFLDHQTELALTEDQMNTIKTLKLESKKAYLRAMTDHKIFSLDVKHMMAQNPVDQEGLNAMIDQMSAAMNTTAKETLASYVKLKAVLTEAQMAKAKELWLQKK